MKTIFQRKCHTLGVECGEDMLVDFDRLETEKVEGVAEELTDDTILQYYYTFILGNENQIR